MFRKNIVCKAVVGAIVFASCIGISPVLAEEGTQTTVTPTVKPTEKPSDSKSNRLQPTPTFLERAKAEKVESLNKVKELKNKIAKKRCEKSITRVQELTEKISSIQDKKETHTLLVEKFEKLSTLLKAKGMNTAQLDTDITQLKTLLAKRTDHESMAIAALKKTADIQCLDKPQEDKSFKTNFDEAKAKIAALNKAAKDEKKQIEEVLKKIRKDIVDLKQTFVTKVQQEKKTEAEKGTN